MKDAIIFVSYSLFPSRQVSTICARASCGNLNKSSEFLSGWVSFQSSICYYNYTSTCTAIFVSSYFEFIGRLQRRQVYLSSLSTLLCGFVSEMYIPRVSSLRPYVCPFKRSPVALTLPPPAHACLPLLRKQRLWPTRR